jgi:hypothetical protein
MLRFLGAEVWFSFRKRYFFINNLFIFYLSTKNLEPFYLTPSEPLNLNIFQP